MDIFILVALILLNGVFAMSEIALVTARHARLSRLADDGDRAAAAALKLGSNPTRFLSTIQIGITSIGILSGIIGQAALAAPAAEVLQRMGVAERTSQISATVVVVLIITYVSIVVGELVPKRLGQINPEGVARVVARPMQLLAILSRPFVHLLSGSTTALLRLFGQNDVAQPGVTEEEIHALLDQGSLAGVIEKNEHTMVRNVFRLDERHIGSLMAPRSDIVWLNVENSLEQNLALVGETEYARYPVCRGDMTDILGIVSTKQLFNQTVRGELVSLEHDLEAPVYVPESLTGMELLDHFRTSGTHIALVVDEYGEILGLVTLRDLIESVTGEFLSTANDGWAVQREDGVWVIDGLIPIVELQDRLGFRTIPEDSRGHYHTVSGMMMWLLGRVPSEGDVIIWEGWRLEVMEVNARRIHRVLAMKLVDFEASTEPGEADAKTDQTDQG